MSREGSSRQGRGTHCGVAGEEGCAVGEQHRRGGTRPSGSRAGGEDTPSGAGPAGSRAGGEGPAGRSEAGG